MSDGEFIFENCSLPNINYSLLTKKTKIPLRMLTHARVNFA